ncbi:MAG: hypothetical protein WA807_01165 [Steroidobacteraceae bacterium]
MALTFRAAMRGPSQGRWPLALLPAAADRNLPLPVVATLAALMGAFHGFPAGAAFASTTSAGLEIATDQNRAANRSLLDKPPTTLR